jgi:hypothetical protein
MRDGFRDIVSGWTLVPEFHAVTDRIERAAAWTKENGPLEPDEAATVDVMIRCQVALGFKELRIDVRPLL